MQTVGLRGTIRIEGEVKRDRVRCERSKIAEIILWAGARMRMPERNVRENPLNLAYQAGIRRCDSLFRLKAALTSVHSFATASFPLCRKPLKPIACLIVPNTGSTEHFLLAMSFRPSGDASSIIRLSLNARVRFRCRL